MELTCLAPILPQMTDKNHIEVLENTAKKEGYAQKTIEQTRFSLIGEGVGFCVSMGAVYLAEFCCPNETRALTGSLAKQLGAWRGTSAVKEQELAKKIMDVTLMNIGGIANMGAQFGLHRYQTEQQELLPFGAELGRVLVGRVGGTATALGALAIAENCLPNLTNWGSRHPSAFAHPSYARFTDLALNNLVQSAGALVGNIPAQLLYDKVVTAYQKAR